MRKFLVLALVASMLIAGAPGPASAEVISPAPQAQTGCRHVIVAGETLSGIAAQYGTDATALAWANGIRDASFIVAGDSISVPCKKLPYVPLVRKTAPGTASPASPAPATNSGSCGEYRVKAGDSLTALSVSLDYPLTSLAEVNGLSTTAGLYTGQKLKLPCD